MNGKLTGKFKNREMIEDENGIEYILVLKNVEEEIKKEIEELKSAKNYLEEEKEKLSFTVKILLEDQDNMTLLLDQCKQEQGECEVDKERLKQAGIAKDELYEETVRKFKEEEEMYRVKIIGLENLVEVSKLETKNVIRKNEEIEELRRLEKERYMQSKFSEVEAIKKNSDQFLEMLKEKQNVCEEEIKSLKQNDIGKDEKHKNEIKELDALIGRNTTEICQLNEKNLNLNESFMEKVKENQYLEKERDMRMKVNEGNKTMVHELRVELNERNYIMQKEKAEKEELKELLVQSKAREEQLIEEKDEIVQQNQQTLKTKDTTIAALKEKKRKSLGDLKKGTRKSTWK